MRRTAGHINPYQIISTGGFDFMPTPGAKAGEPASIVMARAMTMGNEPDVWPSLADRPADAIPRPPQTADAPYDQATYDKLYASSHDPAYAFSMARTMQAVNQAPTRRSQVATIPTHPSRRRFRQAAVPMRITMRRTSRRG
jgi:hypothetical protein